MYSISSENELALISFPSCNMLIKSSPVLLEVLWASFSLGINSIFSQTTYLDRQCVSGRMDMWHWHRFSYLFQVIFQKTRTLITAWKTNLRISLVQHSLDLISAAQSWWEFVSLMPQPGKWKWIFRVHPQRDLLLGTRLFLNSWNFHKKHWTFLAYLFLREDKISLSKMMKKTPVMFTKGITSTEVRKWRLWEFSQPGTGGGKLQTGRMFPAYTSPLIAALSDRSFLIPIIRSTVV